MNTVESWVDAEELRRLAEDLLTPAKEPVPLPTSSSNSSAVTSSLEGEEGEDDRSVPLMAAVTSALETARRVAEGSGILHASKPSQESDDEPDDAPTSVDECLAFDPIAFLSRSEVWQALFAVRSFVIMTSEQEVLLDTLGDTKITQMAQKLACAISAEGNIFMRISADFFLHVMAVSHPRFSNCVWSLGVLVPSPLSRDQIGSLTNSMFQE